MDVGSTPARLYPVWCRRFGRKDAGDRDTAVSTRRARCYNEVTGLGFGGVPDKAELGATERAFAYRGALTQVELAHECVYEPHSLADPSDDGLVPGVMTRSTSTPPAVGS